MKMRFQIYVFLLIVFGSDSMLNAQEKWPTKEEQSSEKSSDEPDVDLNPEAVKLQQQIAVRKIIPNYRVSAVQARKAQDVFQRLMQDAHDAEKKGEIAASLQFLSRALGYVADLGPRSNSALLEVKYQELKLQTPALEWRRVEHRLSDLSRLVDGYPLWDSLQLERALSEAELRLSYQPQNAEMYETMGLLKEEMRLITEIMGERFTPDLRVRYREFLYVLEDKLGL